MGVKHFLALSHSCNLLMGFTDIHMHVKCISQQCVVTQMGKHLKDFNSSLKNHSINCEVEKQ